MILITDEERMDVFSNTLFLGQVVSSPCLADGWRILVLVMPFSRRCHHPPDIGSQRVVCGNSAM